jgi:EAL domain-containing protein (putative c-di-GMP-specific phosphodiesterase class I)/CheY-like chemotaxis protein
VSGAPTGRIRVVVVDDDRLLRETIADLLRDEPDMDLVGVAWDADSAFDVVVDQRPDVAVVDVKMPGGGPAATRGILAVSRGTRVLALSAFDDASSVNEMIRAGAIGYVVKGGPIAETLAAVRSASRGLGYLSAGVTRDVVHDLAGKLDREIEAAELDRELRARLERVLAPGAIRAVFQPVVDLEDGRIAGVEALARIDVEPLRSPDLWFADAERAGERISLELAAIRAQVTAFDEPALGSAYISLNVSPETVLRGDVFDELRLWPSERIVLEVTENEPVVDYDAMGRALAAFRAEGGKLAIDDAGAGFASLRHILDLDPDIIKLDISLTRDIDTHKRRRALATALTAFAKEMGMAVVAEGIETESELATLRTLGVRYGQGFFLRRPGPLAEALFPIDAISAPEAILLRPYGSAQPTGAGRSGPGRPEGAPPT